MAKYLARRIFGGHLDYNAVVAKYPQFKTDIDGYLKEWGWTFPEEDAEDPEPGEEGTNS